MKQILNTIFLGDCIEKLDIKYKNIVSSDTETYFSYANIFDFPLYYNMFALKKNSDYNLYQKLHNNKILDTITFTVEKIKENNYDSKLLLFLYSYICSIYFYHNTNDYIKGKAKTFKFTSKKRKMQKYSKVTKYIEAQFFEDKYNKKVKKFKIKHQAIKIDEQTFNLIDSICSELHFFSLGISVMKIGYNNFKHYQKKNFKRWNLSSKIKVRILDSFTRSKLFSASSIFIKKTPKKDYLNKENNVWINNGKETIDSFYDIYTKTKENACKLINLISEQIFYNTKNTKLIEQHLIKNLKGF